MFILFIFILFILFNLFYSILFILFNSFHFIQFISFYSIHFIQSSSFQLFNSILFNSTYSIQFNWQTKDVQTRVMSGAVVITTGTFLRGSINIGLESYPAGRIGDLPAVRLAETLDRLRFRLGRLKTGTPPRLSSRSIDYSSCSVQKGDDPPIPFSFMNDRVWIEVISTIQFIFSVIRIRKRVEFDLKLNCFSCKIISNRFQIGEL